MPNVDMSVTLAGVTLKNPVVVASGTFGFGKASPSTAGRATPPPGSPRPLWAF